MRVRTTSKAATAMPRIIRERRAEPDDRQSRRFVAFISVPRVFYGPDPQPRHCATASGEFKNNLTIPRKKIRMRRRAYLTRPGRRLKNRTSFCGLPELCLG